MKHIAYIILAVTLLSSCTKDRVNAPNNNVVVTPGNRILLHYWDFNPTDTVLMRAVTYSDTFFIPNTIIPSIEIPATTSTVNVTYDQYTPGTFINARRTSDSGGALRVRNPSTYMILHIPMNGYKSAQLSMAIMRSNKGAKTNNISYTIDGINYISTGLVSTAIDMTPDVDTLWNPITSANSSLRSIDFTGVPGVDDNPKFAVKIFFVGAEAATSGNDRYDNITVDAFRK
jgi:hypothetical protein